jgi:hypothetical protein
MSFVLNAQSSIESVMRKYKNDQNVTSVKYQGENLNKAILRNNKKLKTKLEYVDVIAFGKGSIMAEKDRLKIKAILTQQKFDELINVKSKEGKIKINTLYKNDIISMIYGHYDSNANGNFHVILSGIIYLEEVTEIISSLNLKELDFLENVAR